MPVPTLNMSLRAAGALSPALAALGVWGAALRHVGIVDPVENALEFGFASVPVTGYNFSVVRSPNEYNFGFVDVPVTGFDFSVISADQTIDFGFASVDVDGFAFSVVPASQAVSFGFVSVDVTGFDFTIDEGSAIPSTLKNDLVVAFEWEDNYTELHNAYPTTAINTPPFQDSINGRGIIMRTSTGSREVRIASPGWEALRPLLTDFTVFCMARWQKVDDSIATHNIYNHKGSAGTSSGVKCYYRRDLERFSMEIGNGTERITLVSDVYPQTTFDDGFVPLLFEWDRDGHMKIEIDGVDAGDRDGTSDISSMVSDSIAHTNVASFGNGDMGLDNCYAWTRLLTSEEKTALRTLALGYSDLPA